jgi:glycyl-tRNA synthetase beta chain
MAQRNAADFLVEIGTEELPPKALKDLMVAFGANLGEELQRERLGHGSVATYASPRRLAVLVRDLVLVQEDREFEQKGPPVSVAFDAGGKPTPAARAFAAKCGIPVEQLGRTSSAKGEWLACRTVEAGQSAAGLLPALVGRALDRLPVPRRMRWGALEHEFVRPVHWVLILHGAQAVEGSVLGIEAGSTTRGHRVLAPGERVVGRPVDYLDVLEDAFVIADFEQRRRQIAEGVEKAAADAGGIAIGSAALYDEVASLTEWPVPLTGRFDPAFLALPREVIVATLSSHQRYFAVEDKEGKLLPVFITVANLESKDPGKVRDGNERVVRPRLADAVFFWEQDRKLPLEARVARLNDVVYQKGLGSIGDRSSRIAVLSVVIAEQLGADPAAVERAARLAKCDLLTGMVGEFPELQGIMGRHYALASGEEPSVAAAIGEQYLPRFSGDALPETAAGRMLALAEKLDTLAGIFSLGTRPSGNRDPFGLRRAALGVVRIIVEGRLELDLVELIAKALSLQPPAKAEAANAEADLYDFVLERMRAFYVEQIALAPGVFEAVRVRRPVSLLDFDARVKAVSAFLELDAAASLAASNKRIANILRQANYQEHRPVDDARLEEDAEKELHDAITAARAAVGPLLMRREYRKVLTALSDLRPAVDEFFDDVMVMAEQPALRQNRLALLAELSTLFLDVADISRLSVG